MPRRAALAWSCVLLGRASRPAASRARPRCVRRAAAHALVLALALASAGSGRAAPIDLPGERRLVPSARPAARGARPASPPSVLSAYLTELRMLRWVRPDAVARDRGSADAAAASPRDADPTAPTGLLQLWVTFGPAVDAGETVAAAPPASFPSSAVAVGLPSALDAGSGVSASLSPSARALRAGAAARNIPPPPPPTSTSLLVDQAADAALLGTIVTASAPGSVMAAAGGNGNGNGPGPPGGGGPPGDPCARDKPNPPPFCVPEPATHLLLGSGFAAGAWIAAGGGRRRRARPAPTAD